MRRLLAIAGLSAGITAFGLGTERAEAHPLGNLTVNTSATITVAPEQTTISYVLDLAELPTVQEKPAIASGGDGYAAAKCTALSVGLHLSTGSTEEELVAAGSSMALLPGQGGLETLRVECRFTASGTSRATTLTWSDDNFGDRLGWREVIAVADGTQLTTTLPSVSASDTLRAYPTGVPPIRVLSGTVAARPGGARLATSPSGTQTSSTQPQARGADGLTRRFNRLIGSRHLTVGVGLFAALIAFVLGSLHSLAPGHGKTLMAAMVAGRRGTTRQVLTVGATVAATHTVGVVVLGLAITTSQAFAPDRALPWLTIISGVLLVSTGGWLLLRRALFGAPAIHSHGTFGHSHAHHAGNDRVANHDDHAHPHPHAHPHTDGHDHGTDHLDAVHDPGHHDHGHHDHAHAQAHGHDEDHQHGGPRSGRARLQDGNAPLKTRSLALIGMAGGMVPTPSALVVLLGATALGRAWFGVVLVGVYGVGMAATLLVAGVLLVRFQGWLELRYAQTRWLQQGLRLLPVITSVALIIGGLSLALRGAIAV